METEIDKMLASVVFYTQPPELHVCHAMAARPEREMECEVTRESEEWNTKWQDEATDISVPWCDFEPQERKKEQ